MKIVKCVIIILAALAWFGCNMANNETSSKSFINAASYSGLNQQKRIIDSLAKDTASLIVFAKLRNKSKPVLIKYGKFPNNVEVSYNLLKDKKGRLFYIFESPFSESGDWDIAYKSYFDNEGNLFAFERESGFFNSECTDGAVHEDLVKYYQNTTSIDSTYSLNDDNKKPLVKSKCVFNYDFPYSIYHNSKKYLKAIKINGVF